MSKGDTTLPRNSADRLAETLIEALAPSCERIEVAGSLRRRALHVEDLELVAIASHVPGMFPGQPGDSLLEDMLRRLVEAGRLIHAKGQANGPRQKQFGHRDYPGF